MKEKVYEIELTQTELEILSVIMNPNNFSEVIDYCIRNRKNSIEYIECIDAYIKLQGRIKDIVNTNKHQNV